MNKTTLIGRIVNDVETKNTANGKCMAKIRVAVKRPRTKDTTDFFDVVAWDNLAEICGKYLKKGNKIGISGFFTCRTYEDNQGVKRKVWELYCEDIEMLSFSQTEKATTTEEPSVTEEHEDMPF